MPNSSVCAAYAQMTLISMRKPKNRLSSSSIKDIPKISSKQRSVKSKINLDIQSSNIKIVAQM